MRQPPLSITHFFSGLFVVFAAFVLYADLAYAQGQGSAGSFSCNAGAAEGNLYSSGDACPTTLNMSNLFSFLVCNMEQLASNIMGYMYCGLMQALTPAIWATATLAVVTFGVSFTIGLTPATGQDAIMFLFKLAMVTAFATNADILIGIGYKFFMTAIRETVSVVLSGIGSDTATSGPGVFAVLDKFLSDAIHFATDSVGAKVNADRCKNAIFAVLATMAVAFPIIAYLGLLLLARIALTFLRAIFGYVYAIVGITFLMVLAPFFVCFFLFKETRPFFDKWLGYLASFTLQAIMLFVGMAFVLMIPAKNLTSNLSDVIMFDERTPETTSFRLPWQYCTLCDFKIVDKEDKTTELNQNSENFISRGEMVCKIHPVEKNVTDDQGRKPISLTFSVAPKEPGANGNAQISSLLLLAGNGILALIVLAAVVERLLANLPDFAQRIASGMGASYAPALASAKNVTSIKMPGEGILGDFGTGFRRSFGTLTAESSGRDGLSSAARGVRDGFSAMITGRNAAGNAVTDEAGNAIGIANRYPWLGPVAGIGLAASTIATASSAAAAPAPAPTPPRPTPPAPPPPPPPPPAPPPPPVERTSATDNVKEAQKESFEILREGNAMQQLATQRAESAQRLADLSKNIARAETEAQRNAAAAEFKTAFDKAKELAGTDGKVTILNERGNLVHLAPDRAQINLANTAVEKGKYIENPQIFGATHQPTTGKQFAKDLDAVDEVWRAMRDPTKPV